MSTKWGGTLTRAMATYPITDLRTEQDRLLQHIQQEPVILTKRGRAVAILVDPDMWNRIVATLAEQEETPG